MIPSIPNHRIHTIANGAGFGAAMFLSDDGFDLGEKIAAKTEQIDLDQDANFYNYFINGMGLEK